MNKSLLFLFLAILTSTTLHAQLYPVGGTEIDGFYYNFIGNDELEVTFIS